MRPTIPFSMQQMAQTRAFAEMRDVDRWIQGLVKVHDETGDPYYLHIDHLQILPHPKGNSYQVVTIYHRVYLTRGE